MNISFYVLLTENPNINLDFFNNVMKKFLFELNYYIQFIL